MLLFNSNGMDAVVTEEKLSWRVTGGVLDMFFFPGPNPMQVHFLFCWDKSCTWQEASL